MAVYKVRGPDGAVHLIEGPDDASAADIEAFAAKTIGQPKPVPDDAISRGAKNFAQDGSSVDRFMAGAGKATSDLYNGIRQIGGHLGIGDQAKIQADIDEAKRLDAPLMETDAGLYGNIGGNVAMTLIPATGALKGAQALNMARTANVARAFVNPTAYATKLGTAAGAVGAGMATGAIQPVASDESRLINIGAGGAGGLVGQGVVSGIGRVAQPVRNALSAAAQKAVDTLTAAGVPLDLAQRTGSPTLNRLRGSFKDNIFTLGKQAEQQGAQQDAYTNALMNLVGESGKADQATMGGAMDRTNGVFQDVLSRNNVPLTPKLATALADVQTGALENEKQPVANIINRAFGAVDPASGEIPGQTAYNLVKDMRNMRASSGQDTTLGHYAGKARSAMLDGVNDALSPADLEAFTQARQQQAILHQLEPAINPQTGDISPNKLANVMGQKANRQTSLYGQGPQDLNDLAQAGKMVLGADGPNSGTTARAMAAATIPSLTIGGIDAGYDYFQTGDLGGALGSGAKFGAGVVAAPKLAQYVINSPRLSGLLADGIQQPWVRNALMAPSENALIGSATRRSPNLLYQLLLGRKLQETGPDTMTLPTTEIRGSPAPQ